MRRPIIDEDERKQKIRIKRRAAALKSAAKRRSIKKLHTEHTSCESSCKNLINSKRVFIAERYENLKSSSLYANYNDRISQALSIADHSHDKNHACYVQSYQGVC